MTLSYVTVVFLLAALALSGYVRVRGLEFIHGASPIPAAAILLVVALILDLASHLVVGTQGWLLTFRGPTDKVTSLLWKISVIAQGIGIIFLVLGIWRLFAAITQIVPAGKGRVPRPAPNPPLVTDVDTTD